jgi:7-cyano-7-deazaguanine synthase in queuosine biosynthesis
MIPVEDLGKRNNKKVLLYSGGMDSYIISKIDNFDTLLYIDTKSKYSKIEIDFLKKQNLKNLEIDTRLDLSDVEMQSALVPLRNLFFVSIGTYYGDEIVLGATAGDRSFDKDITFAEKSSDILSYIYSKSWWSEGRNIRVNLKYKDWTKKDLIEEYIKQGYDVQDLINKSFSCYFPDNGKECMKCKPDIRKYTFLSKYIDIGDEKREALRNFYTPNVIQEIKERVGTVHSRGQEDTETLEAIDRDFMVEV